MMSPAYSIVLIFLATVAAILLFAGWSEQDPRITFTAMLVAMLGLTLAILVSLIG